MVKRFSVPKQRTATLIIQINPYRNDHRGEMTNLRSYVAKVNVQAPVTRSIVSANNRWLRSIET